MDQGTQTHLNLKPRLFCAAAPLRVVASAAGVIATHIINFNFLVYLIEFLS